MPRQRAFNRAAFQGIQLHCFAGASGTSEVRGRHHCGHQFVVSPRLENEIRGPLLQGFDGQGKPRHRPSSRQQTGWDRKHEFGTGHSIRPRRCARPPQSSCPATRLRTGLSPAPPAPSRSSNEPIVSTLATLYESATRAERQTSGSSSTTRIAPAVFMRCSVMGWRRICQATARQGSRAARRARRNVRIRTVAGATARRPAATLLIHILFSPRGSSFKLPLRFAQRA